jgi:putative ABC transport system substrate-binding protein
MSRLTRRRFVQGAGIAGLGLLAACGQPLSQTQAPPPPPRRVARVGFLEPDAAAVGESSPFAAFQRGLRDHGYVEGRDIITERRSAGSDAGRLQGFAAELASLPVDIIVTPSAQGALAARQASTSTPIVITAGGDPVALGLVASLAQPGGNVTGLSTLSATLSGKRLELLREAAPTTSRVAIITDSTNPSGANQLRETQTAAQTLGLETVALDVHGVGGLEGVFEAAARERVDALCVLVIAPGPEAARLASFATSSQLPSVFGGRTDVERGGLMSYGADRAALSYRAAYYVDRILKGARPADLPVEQATTFQFVINLKTADALGLTIPPHVLLQATEVIQ